MSIGYVVAIVFASGVQAGWSMTVLLSYRRRITQLERGLLRGGGLGVWP